MATRTKSKTAFVLDGGGSLGAVEVGMLKALTAHGVQADFVVGSSVGAINAAFFAGEPTSEGARGLEEIWRGVRRRERCRKRPRNRHATRNRSRSTTR